MNRNDRESLLTLAALSNQSYETTRQVLEGLSIALLLAYHDEQPFHIPEIGEFSADYVGEEVTPKGRQAKVTITLNPDSFFLRNIGQIEDGEPGDLVSRYQKRIRTLLKQQIEG